jgi:hypothetical protein
VDFPPIDFQWYVPVFEGNRERAKSQPDAAIQVHIKTPSYGSRRRLARAQQEHQGPTLVNEVAKLALRVADLDDKTILTEVRRLIREVIMRHTDVGGVDDTIDGPFFTEHVGAVKNLTLGGIELASGKDLWQHREQLPSPFMDELMRVVNSSQLLEDGLLSRLPWPSGSPASPDTGDGSAPIVAESSST